MTVKITHQLILQIRDDAELTAMARVIEGAQKEATWQGFGSDWDKARFSAYLLREAGFGLVAVTAVEAAQADADLPDDECHTAWCRGDHDGRCRRGRATGTEK